MTEQLSLFATVKGCSALLWDSVFEMLLPPSVTVAPFFISSASLHW
jgi:hypothetical protein